MANSYIEDKSFIKRHTQYSSLYDADFLRELDQSREKTTFARIIALNMDENPIEQVEGRVTQGSVNIDGNSAVRRTCSLTMVSKDMNINDYYWGLNTKFKLEIGLKNTVSYKGHYDQYPDVIWFKMGTYIITQINQQISPNNFTLTIQGKDKMCLLNGDVGGVINARTDFGTYDFYDVDTGITSNYKLPIKQIIWDGVHAYANEPFSNIVINDLDELGLELLEYRYENPLYLIRDAESDEYRMITVDGNFKIKNASDGSTTIKDIHVYDNLTSSMLGDESPVTTFKINNDDTNGTYCAAKIEYGQTAGYRTCELVYAGDLIADVGSTFTQMLDKIKSMLGEFEYFYDLDGRFVFQRKKALVNTVWAPIHRSDDELYVESLALASNSMYDFEGSVLISSFQNSPNLLNLRNDFTVWGNRKGVSGADIPIHMRYAIDNKPYRYITYETDGQGNHYALSTEPADVMNKREELKTLYYRSSGLEDELNNFQRGIFNDPYRLNAYDVLESRNPETGFYRFENGDLWWEIWDWAEYYALAFGEYPGRRHPDDEMQFYCQEKGNVSFLSSAFAESCGEGNQYNMEIHNVPKGGGPSDTCEVFFFKDPVSKEKYITFQPHGTCVHTYAEFLDAEGYVNSGFQTEYNFILKNGNEYHYEFHNLYRDKSYWDYLHTSRGLYHYLVYAYDPKIPADILKELINQYGVIERYLDPYEGQYIQVDWRELIYRMALDYRRHNHEDGFEQIVAQLNYPLYQNGTGYEQYYTDLEGFWRQLYNYPLNEKEEKSLMSYEYKSYNYLTEEELKDVNNLYVEGVYKPIGEKVKATPKDKIKHGTMSAYVHDAQEDKYYYKDSSKKYYISRNNGFTFENNSRLGSSMSNNEFISYCRNGQLFTRDIPNIHKLYKFVNGSIYHALDAENFTTGQYYQKVNVEGETTYQVVTPSTPTLTLDQKSSLYILENQSQYDTLKQTAATALEAFESTRAKAEATATPANGITYQNVTNSEYNNINIDQARNALLAANNALSLFEAGENSGANYTDVVTYFTQQRQNQNNESDTLAYYYVYNEHERCKLSDIRQNSDLTRIYGSGNAAAVKEFTNSILDNTGGKTLFSTTNSITYYLAYSDFNKADEPNPYWNKNVFSAPYGLNFWFDFLEGDNELRQYTTQAVGDRPKAVKEDNVKSIYYRDTPKIIFSTQEKMDSEELKTGYRYFVLPEADSYSNMFTISPQGIDAKNRIDELLYQHSYCTESIQVTSIPIYYLDVNRRIHVFDENSKINGDYVVSRLSYSLTYNGMMNITATKAPENSVTEREA